MPRQAEYNSLDELRQDELFWEARRVFEYMQSADISGQSDEEKLKIKNIMRGYEWWENMSDSDRQNIGKLIAHNWPYFAQACTVPVNLVFVESSVSGEGIYKIVRYNRAE